MPVPPTGGGTGGGTGSNSGTGGTTGASTSGTGTGGSSSGSRGTSSGTSSGGSGGGTSQIGSAGTYRIKDAADAGCLEQDTSSGAPGAPGAYAVSSSCASGPNPYVGWTWTDAGSA
ncbi:hypothetical protein [Streptacidiphilus sp. MAP5-3]|uniref:hypothetical protein n=1 Tax=unclassified Streptacidiphilus TaxID=2643834 RepID=UPI003518622B